jgi:hypothetical protein
MKQKYNCLVVIVFSFSLSAVAGTKSQQVEDLLLFQQWPGPEKAIQTLNLSNSDLCASLVELNSKHPKATFLIQRISQLRERLKCMDNIDFIKKKLNSDDPIILASIM